MKSILVPVSGVDDDKAVLDMAYATALPFAAHLDFVHIRYPVSDLIQLTPDIDFAEGDGLRLALRKLKADREGEAKAARRHVEALCVENDIPERHSPGLRDRVTAAWRTLEQDHGRRLIALAHQHDLAIIGRSVHRSARWAMLIDSVVAESGRPVLLVPCAWKATPIRRIAVWWKAHAAAARAVSAAMPLLAKAEAISFLMASEGSARVGDTGAEMACALGWHGIKADARELTGGHLSAVDRLWLASRQCNADLIVMGAFSHSRTRELVFGGLTQAVLDAGDLPVLLVH